MGADLRCQGGGTWIGAVVAFLWGTGFQMLFIYRLSRWLHAHRLGRLCAPLRWLQYAISASEISPGAVVGPSLHLPHPTGIVIGAGAVVEEGAWIFQQVTIGSHGRPGSSKGYPVVSKRARIYAGAKVLGGVCVGEEAVVAANAVVLQDVPAGRTAVGIPARLVDPE